jgi:UbiA prenyltransferase family./Cohesin domain.
MFTPLQIYVTFLSFFTTFGIALFWHYQDEKAEKKESDVESLPVLMSVVFYAAFFALFLAYAYRSGSILFFCEFSWCAQIQINSQSAQKNDIVTFTVFIHDAPDPVNAFGFDISYDPTCMTYKSVQRGSLISEGFRFFQASNVGFGRIRIGGIETGDNIIHQQDVGSLALIQNRRNIYTKHFSY